MLKSQKTMLTLSEKRQKQTELAEESQLVGGRARPTIRSIRPGGACKGYCQA